MNASTFVPALMVAGLALAGCGDVNPLVDAASPVDAAVASDGGVLEPKFSSLYVDYFAGCKSCHAPNAPGRTSDTETTLNFSTVTTSYQTTASGTAAGLQGNPSACNGVRFVVSGDPQHSLIVAVVDETVRAAYSAPGQAACDQDAVTDMTIKMAGSQPPSAAFLAALKQWITSGAPNN